MGCRARGPGEARQRASDRRQVPRVGAAYYRFVDHLKSPVRDLGGATRVACKYSFADTGDSLGWRAGAGDPRLTPTRRGLAITSDGTGASFKRDLGLNASEATTLVVRMAVAGGAAMKVAWRGEGGSVRGEREFFRAADWADPQDYKVVLDGAPEWSGTITELEIFPATDAPCRARVMEVSLLNEPLGARLAGDDQGPGRIRIDGELRPGLMTQGRSVIEANLTIPPGAFLTFGCGIPQQVRNMYSGGLRFTVEAVDGQGGSRVLHSAWVGPSPAEHGKWRDVSLSLADLQGKDVRIRLRAEPTDPSGDRPLPDKKNRYAYGFWSDPTVWAPQDKRAPNVILISIDACRADHLGCYGYGCPTSPTVDSLAQRSVLFENAWAQANWSLPSHTSMLSGRYPLSYGFFSRSGGTVIGAHAGLLPDILRRAGYATAAYTGGAFVSAAFGLAQGCDTCFEGRQTDQTWNKALAWLDRSKNVPFFLFLHTYHAHDYWEDASGDPRAAQFTGNYRGPLRDSNSEQLLEALRGQGRGFSDADRNFVRGLYDAAIRRTDDYLAALFRHLTELGLDQNTLLILTADHGEGFGEHGFYLHGNSLYEEELHVPLIVRFPGGQHAGLRVAQPVGLVDIAPTVLEAVGLARGNLPGTNLLAVAGGTSPEPRTIFASFAAPGTAKAQFAVRQDNCKLIHAPASDRPVQVYDLRDDASESASLTPNDCPCAKSLLAQLKDYIWRSGRGYVLWGWGDGNERTIQVTLGPGAGPILWASPVFAPRPDGAAVSLSGQEASLALHWAAGQTGERGILVQPASRDGRLPVSWSVTGAPLPEGRARFGEQVWPLRVALDLLALRILTPSELSALQAGGRPLMAMWRLDPGVAAAQVRSEGVSERTREQLRALGYLR